MFQSDGSDSFAYNNDFVTPVNPRTSIKGEAALDIWGEYFATPEKDRNRLLRKAFNDELALKKIYYCFLSPPQIMGKVYDEFGIPNVMGQICKKFIHPYISRYGKKQTKPISITTASINIRRKLFHTPEKTKQILKHKHMTGPLGTRRKSVTFSDHLLPYEFSDNLLIHNKSSYTGSSGCISKAKNVKKDLSNGKMSLKMRWQDESKQRALFSPDNYTWPTNCDSEDDFDHVRHSLSKASSSENGVNVHSVRRDGEKDLGLIEDKPMKESVRSNVSLTSREIRSFNKDVIKQKTPNNSPVSLNLTTESKTAKEQCAPVEETEILFIGPKLTSNDDVEVIRDVSKDETCETDSEYDMDFLGMVKLSQSDTFKCSFADDSENSYIGQLRHDYISFKAGTDFENNCLTNKSCAVVAKHIQKNPGPGKDTELSSKTVYAEGSADSDNVDTKEANISGSVKEYSQVKDLASVNGTYLCLKTGDLESSEDSENITDIKKNGSKDSVIGNSQVKYIVSFNRPKLCPKTENFKASVEIYNRANSTVDSSDSVMPNSQEKCPDCINSTIQCLNAVDLEESVSNDNVSHDVVNKTDAVPPNSHEKYLASVNSTNLSLKTVDFDESVDGDNMSTVSKTDSMDSVIPNSQPKVLDSVNGKKLCLKSVGSVDLENMANKTDSVIKNSQVKYIYSVHGTTLPPAAADLIGSIERTSRNKTETADSANTSLLQNVSKTRQATLLASVVNKGMNTDAVNSKMAIETENSFLEICTNSMSTASCNQNATSQPKQNIENHDILKTDIMRITHSPTYVSITQQLENMFTSQNNEIQVSQGNLELNAVKCNLELNVPKHVSMNIQKGMIITQTKQELCGGLNPWHKEQDLLFYQQHAPCFDELSSTKQNKISESILLTPKSMLPPFSKNQPTFVDRFMGNPFNVLLKEPVAAEECKYAPSNIRFSEKMNEGNKVPKRMYDTGSITREIEDGSLNTTVNADVITREIEDGSLNNTVNADVISADEGVREAFIVAGLQNIETNFVCCSASLDSQSRYKEICLHDSVCSSISLVPNSQENKNCNSAAKREIVSTNTSYCEGQSSIQIDSADNSEKVILEYVGQVRIASEHKPVEEEVQNKDSYGSCMQNSNYEVKESEKYNFEFQEKEEKRSQIFVAECSFVTNTPDKPMLFVTNQTEPISERQRIVKELGIINGEAIQICSDAIVILSRCDTDEEINKMKNANGNKSNSFNNSESVAEIAIIQSEPVENNLLDNPKQHQLFTENMKHSGCVTSPEVITISDNDNSHSELLTFDSNKEFVNHFHLASSSHKEIPKITMECGLQSNSAVQPGLFKEIEFSTEMVHASQNAKRKREGNPDVVGNKTNEEVLKKFGSRNNSSHKSAFGSITLCASDISAPLITTEDKEIVINTEEPLQIIVHKPCTEGTNIIPGDQAQGKTLDKKLSSALINIGNHLHSKLGKTNSAVSLPFISNFQRGVNDCAKNTVMNYQHVENDKGDIDMSHNHNETDVPQSVGIHSINKNIVYNTSGDRSDERKPLLKKKQSLRSQHYLQSGINSNLKSEAHGKSMNPAKKMKMNKENCKFTDYKLNARGANDIEIYKIKAEPIEEKKTQETICQRETKNNQFQPTCVSLINEEIIEIDKDIVRLDGKKEYIKALPLPALSDCQSFLEGSTNEVVYKSASSSSRQEMSVYKNVLSFDGLMLPGNRNRIAGLNSGNLLAEGRISDEAYNATDQKVSVSDIIPTSEGLITPGKVRSVEVTSKFDRQSKPKHILSDEGNLNDQTYNKSNQNILLSENVPPERLITSDKVSSTEAKSYICRQGKRKSSIYSHVLSGEDRLIDEAYSNLSDQNVSFSENTSEGLITTGNINAINKYRITYSHSLTSSDEEKMYDNLYKISKQRVTSAENIPTYQELISPSNVTSIENYRNSCILSGEDRINDNVCHVKNRKVSLSENVLITEGSLLPGSAKLCKESVHQFSGKGSYVENTDIEYEEIPHSITVTERVKHSSLADRMTENIVSSYDWTAVSEENNQTRSDNEIYTQGSSVRYTEEPCSLNLTDKNEKSSKDSNVSIFLSKTHTSVTGKAGYVKSSSIGHGKSLSSSKLYKKLGHSSEFGHIKLPSERGHNSRGWKDWCSKNPNSPTLIGDETISEEDIILVPVTKSERPESPGPQLISDEGNNAKGKVIGYNKNTHSLQSEKKKISNIKNDILIQIHKKQNHNSSDNRKGSIVDSEEKSCSQTRPVNKKSSDEVYNSASVAVKPTWLSNSKGNYAMSLKNKLKKKSKSCILSKEKICSSEGNSVLVPFSKKNIHLSSDNRSYRRGLRISYGENAISPTEESGNEINSSDVDNISAPVIKVRAQLSSGNGSYTEARKIKCGKKSHSYAFSEEENNSSEENKMSFPISKKRYGKESYAKDSLISIVDSIKELHKKKYCSEQNMPDHSYKECTRPPLGKGSYTIGSKSSSHRENSLSLVVSEEKQNSSDEYKLGPTIDREEDSCSVDSNDIQRDVFQTYGNMEIFLKDFFDDHKGEHTG